MMPTASAAATRVIKTATSLKLQMVSMYEPTVQEVELPEGFIPCACACVGYDTFLRLLDDKGEVLALHEESFKFGPIDFWRPVEGKLRCEITCDGAPSVLPCATITIYGEIDID